MGYVKRIAYQSYLAKHGDAIKLEGEDRIKKMTKYNIANFFVLKVHSYNII